MFKDENFFYEPYEPYVNQVVILESLQKKLKTPSTRSVCSFCFPDNSSETEAKCESVSTFDTCFSISSIVSCTKQPVIGPWAHLLQHFENNGSSDARKYIAHPLGCSKCRKILNDLEKQVHFIPETSNVRSDKLNGWSKRMNKSLERSKCGFGPPVYVFHCFKSATGAYLSQ